MKVYLGFFVILALIPNHSIAQTSWDQRLECWIDGLTYQSYLFLEDNYYTKVSFADFDGDGDQNMILCSDQGSQYASKDFQKLLNRNGIKPIMGGKSSCYDNAINETFFHTLKAELIYFESYQTREEAGLSIFEYIAVFHDRHRRHSTLVHRLTVAFENQLDYVNNVSASTWQDKESLYVQ